MKNTEKGHVILTYPFSVRECAILDLYLFINPATSL